MQAKSRKTNVHIMSMATSCQETHQSEPQHNTLSIQSFYMKFKHILSNCFLNRCGRGGCGCGGGSGRGCGRGCGCGRVLFCRVEISWKWAPRIGEGAICIENIDLFRKLEISFWASRVGEGLIFAFQNFEKTSSTSRTAVFEGRLMRSRNFS